MDSWYEDKIEVLSRNVFERDKSYVVVQPLSMRSVPSFSTDCAQECFQTIYKPIDSINSKIQHIEITRDKDSTALLKVAIIFNSEVSEEEVRRNLWTYGFTDMALRVDDNKVKLTVYPEKITRLFPIQNYRVQLNAREQSSMLSSDHLASPISLPPPPARTDIFTGNSAIGLDLLFRTVARFSSDEILEFRDFLNLAQERRIERIVNDNNQVLTQELYHEKINPEGIPTFNIGPKIIYVDPNSPPIDRAILNYCYVNNAVLVLNLPITREIASYLLLACQHRHPNPPFEGASILFAEACSITTMVVGSEFSIRHNINDPGGMFVQRYRVFEVLMRFEAGREFLARQCAMGLRISEFVINRLPLDEGVTRSFALCKFAQKILCEDEYRHAQLLTKEGLSNVFEEDGEVISLYHALTLTPTGRGMLASREYALAKKSFTFTVAHEDEDEDPSIRPEHIMFVYNNQGWRSPLQNLLDTNTRESMLVAYNGYYADLLPIFSALMGGCVRTSQRSALRRLPREMGALIAEMLMENPLFFKAIVEHLKRTGSEDIRFDEETRDICEKYMYRA